MPQIIHEIQIASVMITLRVIFCLLLIVIIIFQNESYSNINVSRVFKEYDEIMASCVVVSSIEFNNEPLGITPS